jgi:hypothetical protein
MSRIIAELGDAWVKTLIGRAGGGAPDHDTLEEAARDLSSVELIRLFDNYGHPGSHPLIRNRSIRQRASVASRPRTRAHLESEALVGFYAIDVGELEREEQDQFLSALQSLHPIVKSAVFEASYRGAGTLLSAAPPAYRRDQCYLDAIGVDDVPNNGNWYGVGFADVDVGWNLEHEALRHIGRPRVFPVSSAEIPTDTHGTAVLGVIVGSAKIQGIARGASVKALIFPTRGRQSIPEQILDFLDAEEDDALQFGDILLIEIEQEAGRGVPEGLPVEVQPAMFRVIQLAVSRGIIVIEAAGNGTKSGSVRIGWDLDEIARDGRYAPAWRQTSKPSRPIPCSGAIIVSGCTPSFPERIAERYAADDRLNFGSRVDCYGFGSGVVTCGDNFPPPSGVALNHDDPNIWYDCGFGMTSAAAATVTGAALAIQRMAHEELGYALSPFQLRALLKDSACGTSVRREGSHAGIVPHLAKVRQVLLRLPPPPQDPVLFPQNDRSVATRARDVM